MLDFSPIIVTIQTDDFVIILKYDVMDQNEYTELALLMLCMVTEQEELLARQSKAIDDLTGTVEELLSHFSEEELNQAMSEMDAGAVG